MVERLRRTLRGNPLWRDLSEASREGFVSAVKRVRTQRRILATPPVLTDREGPIEVRVLTWRRDWLSLLWALKSFYHYSGVRYPLYVHDGGLEERQRAEIFRHFPQAVWVGREESDARVQDEFRRSGWNRCLAYRAKNPTTRKLFDFFCLSKAEVLLSIDSDIVFFRPALELASADLSNPVNLYNQDAAYWYSLPIEELEARFHLSPPERINSGLSRVYRSSMRFDRMEEWLADEDLFADKWVTEQTLHALASAAFRVRLLPAQYALGTERGLPDNCVCKHYPGYFRPLLYQEGMTELIARGFLREAGRPFTAAEPIEAVGSGAV